MARIVVAVVVALALSAVGLVAYNTQWKLGSSEDQVELFPDLPLGPLIWASSILALTPITHKSRDWL